MFDFKELDLLARAYYDRDTETLEEKAVWEKFRKGEEYQAAVAAGIKEDDLSTMTVGVWEDSRRIGFKDGAMAVIRMLAMSLCRGGKTA